MQRALFYAKHADKFTSPKHNLLVFQVRTNTARIETYKEVGATNLLLKLIFSIVLITFLKYVLLSSFYHSKGHGLRTRRI